MRNSITVIIIVLTSLLLLVGPAFAETDVELYNDGNKAYRDGDYEKSLELYNQIKTVNPDVLYNKAVAAYKTGRLGKALVNLYRAERLNPGDSDIRANIDFLNNIKIDKERIKKPGVIEKGMDGLLSIYQLRKTSIWFLLCYLIFSGMAIHQLVSIKERRINNRLYLIATGGVVTLLLGLVVAVQVVSFEKDDQAVTIAKEAAAFAAPADTSSKVFTFHEGTKVTIWRTEGDYAFIFVSSGLSGWVKRSALERI